MKIESLQITNFGHFTDLALSFESGLQVIHGPNEAGKTTLLEFLRGWLFDFETRSPYNFKGTGEMAGSGSMILSSGCRLELNRRKGTRRKMQVKLDGRAEEMDDDGLLHLLSSANEHLFRSVFAFGLKELAAGEESLKHESLQSALFGGGLGISAGPERISTELKQQAEVLFSSNSRAHKPQINTALREIKELDQQLKKKNLKSDEYHQCRSRAEEAEAESQRLRGELDALRVQLARMKRLSDAWPKWREWQQLQSELAGLPVPPAAVNKDLARRMEGIRARRRELQEDREQCEVRIRDAQKQSAELHRKPEFLVQRSAIKHCLQNKKSYLDARRDLPKVEAEAAQLADSVARSLAELRPGWTVEQLREFRVELRTRAELDQLLQKRRTLNEHRHAAERSLKERSREAEVAAAELQGIEPPIDTAELQLIVRSENECTAAQQRRDGLKRELAKLQAELTALVRKLSPLNVPEEMPAGLVRLPIPRVEAIENFAGEFAEIHEERSEAARTERSLRRNGSMRSSC
ncbi:MAG: AAA family ATPase [Pirellulales bacterium]